MDDSKVIEVFELAASTIHRFCGLVSNMDMVFYHQLENESFLEGIASGISSNSVKTTLVGDLEVESIPDLDALINNLVYAESIIHYGMKMYLVAEHPVINEAGLARLSRALSLLNESVDQMYRIHHEALHHEGIFQGKRKLARDALSLYEKYRSLVDTANSYIEQYNNDNPSNVIEDMDHRRSIRVRN
jgi:hypothetical protein